VLIVEEYLGNISQYEYDKKNDVLKVAVIDNNTGIKLISYKIFKSFFHISDFIKYRL